MGALGDDQGSALAAVGAAYPRAGNDPERPIQGSRRLGGCLGALESRLVINAKTRSS